MMGKWCVFLLALMLWACSPVIKTKPEAVSPTDTAQATAAPTRTATATPPATAEVTASEALNVRRGPGETYPAYDKGLRHGDSVTLTGRCQSGWAQIAWQGGAAWVNASYLLENKCQTKSHGDASQ